MNKLKTTLQEISVLFKNGKTVWLLTRYNTFSKAPPNDLDILVKPKDFINAKKSLELAGYKLSSHDMALGGRIQGAQINCSKKDRIKIDLHQDFTWRKTKYFDEDVIWNNIEAKTIEGVKLQTPQKAVDALIVAVNIIFEKTYVNFEEKLFIEYFTNIEDKTRFIDQAKKYKWKRSLEIFIKWLNKSKINRNKVTFLPVNLILYSYIQKFDLLSFCYYVFFRIRFFLNATLPYE